MGWLRLRNIAWYLRLPGAIYWGLAVAVWTATFLWLRAGILQWAPWYEWLVFVIAPGLAGVGHFVAPREVRGGKPYWALSAIWLGAAGFGVLAHWHTLDPATPWLSLVRYCLIVVGGLLYLTSGLASRPGWARQWESVGPGRAEQVESGIAIVLFAGLVALVPSHVPLRLALAPPVRGTSVRRVQAMPPAQSVYWVTWNADSRLVAAVASTRARTHEVWIIDTVAAKKRVLVKGALVSGDRPWLPDGSGVVLSIPEGKQAGIWSWSADGEHRRRLISLEKLGPPTCSPDGRAIAFTKGPDLWISDGDGANPRLLAPGARSPRWSPDGKHILYVAQPREPPRRPLEKPYRIVTMDGRVTPLPIARIPSGNLKWLNPQELVAYFCDRGGELRIFGLSYVGVVSVWDCRGRLQRAHRFGTDLIPFESFSPGPDGRTILLNACTWPVLPVGQSVLHVLDTYTGDLRAVPADTCPQEVAWSPDGSSIAFDGSSSRPIAGEQSEGAAYLAVISGL